MRCLQAGGSGAHPGASRFSRVSSHNRVSASVTESCHDSRPTSAAPSLASRTREFGLLWSSVPFLFRSGPTYSCVCPLAEGDENPFVGHQGAHLTLTLGPEWASACPQPPATFLQCAEGLQPVRAKDAGWGGGRGGLQWSQGSSRARGHRGPSQLCRLEVQSLGHACQHGSAIGCGLPPGGDLTVGKWLPLEGGQFLGRDFDPQGE